MINNHTPKEQNRRDGDPLQQDERGITMMEVLVGLLLMGIIGMMFASSFTTGLRVATITAANHAASCLATSRMEELAAVDTLDLDSSYNENAVSVSWPDISFPFARTTQVITNADNSRTITVSVSSTNSAVPTSVSFSTTLAMWE